MKRGDVRGRAAGGAGDAEEEVHEAKGVCVEDEGEEGGDDGDEQRTEDQQRESVETSPPQSSPQSSSMCV